MLKRIEEKFQGKDGRLQQGILIGIVAVVVIAGVVGMVSSFLDGYRGKPQPSVVDYKSEALKKIEKKIEAPIKIGEAFALTEEAADLYNAAYDAQDAGDSQKAVKLWTQLLKQPNLPAKIQIETRINRAWVYANLQPFRCREAIADSTAVLAMANVDIVMQAKAYVNRGIAYQHLAKPEHGKAILDFTAIISMKGVPADIRAAAHVSRAWAYMLSTPPKFQNTIDDCTAALGYETIPTRKKAEAYSGRAWARWELNRDAKGLVEDARASVAIAPLYGPPHINLGLGLLLLDKVEEARSVYRAFCANPKMREWQGCCVGAVADINAYWKDIPDSAKPVAKDIMAMLNAAAN